LMALIAAARITSPPPGGRLGTEADNIFIVGSRLGGVRRHRGYGGSINTRARRLKSDTGPIDRELKLAPEYGDCEGSERIKVTDSVQAGGIRCERDRSGSLLTFMSTRKTSMGVQSDEEDQDTSLTGTIN
jgi:hypothetical protein